MIQIDREMQTCCEDCFAKQEYYNPRWDETEYSCGVNGENLGTHSRRDLGEWHCDRPKWCPLKEQEAKPMIEHEGGWSCPSCGMKLIEKTASGYPCALIDLPEDEPIHFCPKCGQEVTWDD